MHMDGKTFEGVADTLYIPLTARVYVSKRFPEYFYDSKSLELEPAIPGSSIQKGSNEYTMIASAARYHNLDEMARSNIAKHPSCNVVNVGCGLETMFWRIGPDAPNANFYAMDLPDVIETRRRVLGEPEGESLIAGDAFDLSWASGIDAEIPTLIIVSGVFQYFHNADVLGFIADAKRAFADAELIFDAMTMKAVSYAAKYIKKTGNNDAMLYFGTDDPEAFVMSQGYDLIETRPFFTQARKQLKKKLKLYTRIAMKVVDEGGRRGFLVHCG